ncbi:MAG: Asp-tRNA(Asn)/Glu-tRNA(Gln) amidotransferase subunit GatB [Chitinivibrionales bacterium]|nr:Asp-tRNA(Asn)/Glu-tRNA(Gln) amidotransferase subunit GatB [Chitinivibrionales bacterium]
MKYEVVIGLEIHAQLLTKTKIFCPCPTIFGSPANTQGCPVCLGLPGSLPVLNKTAVEFALMAGLAMDCTIAPESIFSRKNYFYPDLPKGYQISQYDLPVCRGGRIILDIDGIPKTINLTRIHLEEDAGKLIHDQDADSLFDVNRCGTPLIEIVSEPELRSPQEAYSYLSAIKQILEYLAICDCNMEEGSLRCDANISLRPFGQAKLGTKTELKNMNTFRGVEKALEYEIERQTAVLDSGGVIEQQTFLWNAATGTTAPMRSKEDAHDYRYFPEPDLAPLRISDEWVGRCGAAMPELPRPRRLRFVNEYKISPLMADALTAARAVADYFEEALLQCNDAPLVGHWIMGEVLRVVKESDTGIAALSLTPARLGALLNLVRANTISAAAAKKVFSVMQARGDDPGKIVAELGLNQVSDSSELEKVVRAILEGSPQEVSRYKSGDKKLASFFIGQAMKATKGKGNPQEISRLVSKLLG